ncbi:2-methylisocitrate lyase [Knoellia sinensis KCTC 19936]|uniref:2-methylisocitrate lyase n=1 Tax=Knoellia sinensis KCTC 19936 TaxID=1385520 RepID=A0A0A0JBW1_9MICO|nr:isocitrate lyase/phosphoenolpyruvate mutase family protein [Knoellia sinensis]KGN34299.1 2-methylisocitrate lyase [Knoellia sinensis KCTC 19936]
MTSLTPFAELHASDLFVMPNAFDAGSAKRLAEAGYPAIATTSHGHAATLGKPDLEVTRDELVAHVALLTSVVDVPVNVDSADCFPREEGGVARTVELLAEAGASGLSIEDYDPVTQAIVSWDEAVARVATVVEVAHAHGIVVTARCESVLYGLGEDPIERLAAYRDAGAEVLFAPLVNDEAGIAAIVALGAPVNFLAAGDHPSVARLRELGVRRVSTGGALTTAAYDAAVAYAQALT